MEKIGLLDGMGKRLRHVKVMDIEALDKEKIDLLIQRAFELDETL